MDPCLAVIMPCYNEVATLAAAATRVLASPYTRELVIVDDGSTDGSLDAARALDDPRVAVVPQDRNRGKGAAVRRGIEWVAASATAPFVLIHDADLEYDPADLAALVQPLLDDRADVVYGSRFVGGAPHRVLHFWHSVGNKGLTMLSNMFTDLNLTDMEVGYKAFRREVLASITVEEDRFGIEPELTGKIAAAGRWRVYEVGISYAGRTYAEGKKIGWKDGIRSVVCIVKYSPLAIRRRVRAGRRPGTHR
ncbi:MAG: glycosyltransferase family 2 protein [Acidimicrobiales bacterium]